MSTLVHPEFRWGSILNLCRNPGKKKRPEVFEKLNLKVSRSGFFLSTFYKKVYWDSGVTQNLQIFKNTLQKNCKIVFLTYIVELRLQHYS